jgi:hypothetical protein
MWVKKKEIESYQRPSAQIQNMRHSPIYISTLHGVGYGDEMICDFHSVVIIDGMGDEKENCHAIRFPTTHAKQFVCRIFPPFDKFFVLFMRQCAL